LCEGKVSTKSQALTIVLISDDICHWSFQNSLIDIDLDINIFKFSLSILIFHINILTRRRNKKKFFLQRFIGREVSRNTISP
jgi:hypothetical protein